MWMIVELTCCGVGKSWSHYLWRTCDPQLENWALSVTNMVEMVALQISVFQVVRVKAMSTFESSVQRGTKKNTGDQTYNVSPLPGPGQAHLVCRPGEHRDQQRLQGGGEGNCPWRQLLKALTP